MGTLGKRGSSTIVASALTLLVLVAALGLAACGGSSTTASSSLSTAPSQAAASPSAAPSPSATPLPTPTVAGTIVFGNVVEAMGNSDIYTVNADGSGLTPLVQDPAWEEHPSWSPDGRRIAFTKARSFHGDGSNVWVMNANGSGQVKVTRNGGFSPSWSPDGKRIVFASGGIWVVSPDGSGLKRVTRPQAEGDDWSPAWAPNGKIVFLRIADAAAAQAAAVVMRASVYEVNPDGSGLVRLAKGVNASDFGLSPDGTMIAFQDSTSRLIEVLTVPGGGTPVTLFTPVPWRVSDPNFTAAWKSNGKTLVAAPAMFYGLYGSPLFVVNADGSSLSAVPNIAHAIAPDWRPE